jgi:hypothetical protein
MEFANLNDESDGPVETRTSVDSSNPPNTDRDQRRPGHLQEAGGVRTLEFILTGRKSVEMTFRGGDLVRRDFEKLIALLEITSQDLGDETMWRISDDDLDADSSREA